jgi:hypothetical protein
MLPPSRTRGRGETGDQQIGPELRVQHMPHRVERRLQEAAHHGVADHRDKMVELGQGRDEFLKGRVVMGIAHDALSVAAEH